MIEQSRKDSGISYQEYADRTAAKSKQQKVPVFYPDPSLKANDFEGADVDMPGRAEREDELEAELSKLRELVARAEDAERQLEEMRLEMRSSSGRRGKKKSTKRRKHTKRKSHKRRKSKKSKKSRKQRKTKKTRK